MAKVKLIYKKRHFDVEKESSTPFDYSYSKINDIAIPKIMLQHNIDVVEHKRIWTDENLLILRSDDSKKTLKAKIWIILDNLFAGKIEIMKLK